MNKKMLSLVAAGAITITAMSGGVASAAGVEGSKDVNVTYNNQNSITDPDNPGSPEWQVAIPSGINFTDTKKTVDTSIELQNPDGSTYSGDELEVNVSVASENGYKLTKGSSSVGYTLSYGSKTMNKDSGVKEQISTLTETSTKEAGQARLSDDVATELGNHIDKLTYTVQKQ
ncbi:hypothetical protein GCM10008904_13150 [Paraclostridium ghonii]|uniref:Uncharacterized protein n=1 Tax=Paraclostridium ghonii TaxID=29358 RepID=A0ABU0N355_9FIRM|nr:hypothetical protein [Paeniclostridium ghonii]MDQ0557593.1 hypothetical protein [Paeniclostridium ghonii]